MTHPVGALTSALPDRQPRIHLDHEQTADILVQIARAMGQIDGDSDAGLVGRMGLTQFRDLATAVFAAEYEETAGARERAAEEARDSLAAIMADLDDLPLTVLDTAQVGVAA